MKLWGGRFEDATDGDVEAFSSSFAIDQRLWEADIYASVAHARMLGSVGVLTSVEAEQLIAGLSGLAEDLRAGKIELDPTAEDVHSAIEIALTARIGPVAGKLHTARSRNDQVATDTRLFLAGEVTALSEDLRALQEFLASTAEKHLETVLPGFTHLQHAQPVSLGHHLLAYFWMFQRDRERLRDSLPRILSLPLGSAALAGTGFPLDRAQVATELGFAKATENSLDAVGDRDFVIEFLAHASMTMMHLSRLCEELILWSTPEFGFVELSSKVTTGSSIMPQKKNPDVAELIRGRVGRAYGALMGALTMMKALPMAYNRDLQEDKTFLFEGLDTVRSCTRLMLTQLKEATWKVNRMSDALRGDFSNATDLADDLALKGVAFREAHGVVGRLVLETLKSGRALEDLTVADLRKIHPAFNEGSVAKLAHGTVMKARTSEGGTAPTAVREQLVKAWAAVKT